jgi:phage tail sheath protein FI
MPTSYLTPGIYVEEVSTGARPIEAVGTSTAAFIGKAPRSDRHLQEVVAINNWQQFLQEFVEKAKPVEAVAAGDPSTATPPDQSTEAKTKTAVAADTPPESTDLSHAVFGFFQNGGSRCYIVNIGDSTSLLGSGTGRDGLNLLEALDEIAIVAAPGFSDAGAYDDLLTHCETMRDRVAILDTPKAADVRGLLQVATADAGGKSSKASGAKGQRPRGSDRGYGAVYYPYITIRDPLSPSPARLVDVPPSGHIAGIYARTDSERGVHKAPANETVRGALNVSYLVTPQEQGELNPQGVNCIRLFPGEGIRVWGARTLAPGASEWRYVNVRRLFNLVEESIARGTRWIVFEPNDASLWKSIRRDISAFLTLLWRQGALMGATPEEAFFVQCDAETNTQDIIDAGQVVAVIGICPVKPAEFVIFRIGQSAAGTEVVQS